MKCKCICGRLGWSEHKEWACVAWSWNETESSGLKKYWKLMHRSKLRDMNCDIDKKFRNREMSNGTAKLVIESNQHCMSIAWDLWHARDEINCTCSDWSEIVFHQQGKNPPNLRHFHIHHTCCLHSFFFQASLRIRITKQRIDLILW